MAAAEELGRRWLRGDGATDLTAAFLRRVATAEERKLRPHLACLDGYCFQFQALIRGWVADFYCARLRLALEVDGGSHKGREQHDALRTDVLQANHIRVVRIPNELVRQDLQAALSRIRSAIEQRAGELERRSRRRPIPELAFEYCRHGNDSLLCRRCQLVERAMGQGTLEPGREHDPSPPRRGGSESRCRLSGTRGLVNRPPSDPGTVSRQNY